VTATVVTTVTTVVVAAVVATVMMTATAGASHGVVPLGVRQHQRDYWRSRQSELAARGEKAAPGFDKLVRRRRI
jgi:hypothetical protein